jgi:hypothetical protein
LNPLEGSDESEEEEEGKDTTHTDMMADGGFTIIAPEKTGDHKGKGSDGVNTV